MNTNLTEIAYLLDRSGSMDPMTEAAIAGFNEFLQEQLDTPGEKYLESGDGSVSVLGRRF